jgi:uncharacterized protein (TIGR03083 family)
MGELADLVRSERVALVGFLETLPADEWATQSLCEAWTVQDVAAHLAWAPAQPPLDVTLDLIRGGFRLNRVNADNARRWSRRGPEAILGQLRTNVAEDARPVGMPEVAALADAVVHAIDIRRALGRQTRVTPAAFAPTADFFAEARWPLTIPVGGSARQRIEDVRLVADDVDWSHGQGPEVHGSADSLLLLLTGRTVRPDELTGPGAAKLYARLT